MLGENETRQLPKDELAARVTTDSQSPWFSGHFPDNPILPGIAQLKMVADLIAASRQDDVRLTGVSRVKFRKIVRPGETLDIHATFVQIKEQYMFRITSGNAEVCSGVMFFAKKNQEIETSMPNDPTQTVTRIAEIIINELKLEDVTPQTFDADLDLVDEVGIDSMDLATIALVLRDEYGIRIDEDDYPKLTTVRIIAEYINTKLTSGE
jgi:acyl carrier protein